MLDGSQTASYEITLFSPTASYKITLLGQSVRLSIHLSITNFYQDWIIVFFLILYMMIADHEI